MEHMHEFPWLVVPAFTFQIITTRSGWIWIFERESLDPFGTVVQSVSLPYLHFDVEFQIIFLFGVKKTGRCGMSSTSFS